MKVTGYWTLFRANCKRHWGGLLGLSALVLIISLTLASVLAVWTNSEAYERQEMERMGYGDLTVWTSGEAPELLEEIEASGLTERSGVQPLLYADYSINGQKSDSEGQLIAYQPDDFPYRFFTDNLSGYRAAPDSINAGEVYVSPSICSVYGAGIGDTIYFDIARSGGTAELTVRGFFEDPFMGSSMIGMKGFLISEQDRTAFAQTISGAGIDALAEPGMMLHLFRHGNNISTSEWGEALNQATSLPEHTKFSHSCTSIMGFMLLLQNVFAGLFLTFTIVLLCVSLFVLGHIIRSAIERDAAQMGILKTLGLTAGMLRRIQFLQYLVTILSGIVCGVLAAARAVPTINRMMVTTTGILVPANLPLQLCAVSFGVVLILLLGFAAWKTGAINAIAPLHAIRGTQSHGSTRLSGFAEIRKDGLELRLALRQLATGIRQYVGVCATAALLVFFASLVGRLDAWLGPDGKGLMDAFNPADHDIGVQCFGSLSAEEAESLVASYTGITEKYLLAMPSVDVNGVNYTANVITEPERFHILRGRTCTNDNEVVLTEFLAADIGANIGDTIEVASGSESAEYIVSGFYQCANDMGANLGMSREGYGRIGQERPEMWCAHYFLTDASRKPEIIDALEHKYGGDVHVHENSWPGLYGILTAMRTLMVVMYIVIAAFVLIVVILIGGRVLSVEKKDLSVCRALGFSVGRLRRLFALRFGLAATAGAVAGAVLSAVLTDPLADRIMRLCGISDFSSNIGISGAALPVIVICALFLGFAYLISFKIRNMDLHLLLTE